MSREPNKDKASLFDRIGGLAGARALADSFYDVMQREVSTRTLLHMHPQNLSRSRTKLYRFITEWFGGPPLFGTRQVNQPWLRLRHQHLVIGTSERDQWLYCMQQAMIELHYTQELQAECMNKFLGAAEYVRNS